MVRPGSAEEEMGVKAVRAEGLRLVTPVEEEGEKEEVEEEEELLLSGSILMGTARTGAVVVCCVPLMYT